MRKANRPRSKAPVGVPRVRPPLLAAIWNRGLAGSAVALLVCVTAVVATGAYLLAARESVEVLAINIPDPLASSEQGITSLTYPGPSADSFDVTFALSEREGEGVWRLPAEARLEVQVETRGRSLRLALSEPQNDTGERVRGISDRQWLDLGPIPRDLRPRMARVRSIRGERFHLLRTVASSLPDLREITARTTARTASGEAEGPPRYRIVVARPIPIREALARLTVFPAMGFIPAAALVLGLAGAVLGCALFFRRPLAGALVAVLATLTVHGALRPPLHGEDESVHVATVEVGLFAAGKPPEGSFPQSIERVGSLLDQDRVQFNPRQVLPVANPASREVVAHELRGVELAAAGTMGPALPLAGTLNVDVRAPLYYGSFRLFKPLLARLGVLDRVFAYRLVSALLAFGALALGAVLLSFAFPGPGKLILYAISALLPPYLVSLVTTVSNYSLAIGLGQLMAASLVTAIASERRRARIAGLVLLLVASLAGLGVYRDVAGFLPAAFLLALLAGPVVVGTWAWRREGWIRAAGVAAAVLTPVSAAAFFWVALVSRPDRVSRLVAFILARKPASAPALDDPIWFFVAQVVLAPFAVGLVLALLGLLGRRLGERAAWRLAVARSVGGLVVLLGLFFATDFRRIPFENLRMSFEEEVRAFGEAFLSTTFSFDQDVLSWKLYWGVFGWTDTFYPDVVYAVAKWACLALFLALPVLCWKTQRERPVVSALLLAFAGLAVTLAFASNTARYFIPVNPWGRFILPWVPLAIFPAVARIDLTEKRETALKWVFVGTVCFHLWTAIYVVGVRYYIPR